MKSKTILLDISGFRPLVQVNYTVTNNIITVENVHLIEDLPVLMSDLSDDLQKQILKKLKT